MSAPSSLYLADTNIYVMAANNPEFRQRLEIFIQTHGPLVVSAVVVAEVLIGIPDSAQHGMAIQALRAGTAVVAPATEDWIRASAAVAQLGGEAMTKTRSFWNDALLAAQCARLGTTLVTSNIADFRRLGRYIGVRTVAPFL